MPNFNVQDFMNLLGPAFGAYAGATGSGGQTQTATQSPYFQPYQNEIASAAHNLWSKGMPTYQGQTWAGPTDRQYQGWDATAGWASGQGMPNQMRNNMAYTLSQGSPFQATAGTAQQQTAGQQLASNPYIAMNSPQASNSYIGQTSQGVGQSPSVLGLLGNAPSAVTGTAASAGPAAQTSVTNAVAASNPYFGFDNPYTERAIADATRDMTRNFNQNTMPQLDRLAQQSGSFGNSGVQQMQQNAMSDFSRDYGDVANRMRMQDLAAQQQMGESAAGRGTNVNLANAGAANQAGMWNAGANNQMNQYNAGNQQQMNLANMAAQNQANQFGYGLNANLGMFDVGNIVGNQRFNASLGAGDLARNAQMMQNMSQFNVGNQVGDVRQMQNLAQQQGQFNASQGNALNQFNANQGNAMNMWNTGQQNDMSRFNTGNNINAYNAAANLYGQIDQQDYNRAQALTNVGTQQQGQAQAGLNNNYQQWLQQMMAPYNNMNWYSGMINPLNGGQTNSQYYPGNPWLGGLSGGLTFGSMMPYLFGG